MKKSFKNIICLIFLFAAVAAVFFAAARLLEVREKRAYPIKYRELVEAAAEKHGVPAVIIYSVIRTESAFDPDAQSRAGAKGLMQITPDTYDWLLFIRKEEKSKSLNDPETNIEFGTFFLSYLHDKFKDWDTAFAAYNAGMNRVISWLGDKRYSSGGVLVEIPYTETENYVKKVNNAIEKYKRIYDM